MPFSKFRYANKKKLSDVDLPVFNMSMDDGENTTVNDILLSSDSATYDGAKRTSVNTNRTVYTVGTSLDMVGNTTSLLVDFEVSSFDATNSVWLLNDRLMVTDGRFQMLYSNATNEVHLTIFTDSSNFVQFVFSYVLNLNTRVKIEFIYDDNTETATLFIDDVSQSVTKTVTGTFAGIRTGTSGTLVYGARGWDLAQSTMIGFTYQATMKQV